MFDSRLLIGVWSAAVAIGSHYAADRWMPRARPESAPVVSAPASSLRKLQPLTVPIIANGQVEGYVVARMSLQVDETGLKATGLPPEPFVVDEAFRYVYGEAGVDFRKLARADIGRIRGEILRRSAARLKTDAVKDLLFEEFNFVPRTENLR